MSRTLAQQQRLAEATDHARQTVELAPGWAAGYQQLVSLLIRQEQYEETIKLAREGLGLAAFSPELRFGLGSGLVFSGQSTEGIDQLQLACALKPKWGEPHILLGESLAKAGKPRDALNHLREAVRLEPGNADVRCQLAIVLGAQHETPEAIAEYAEALRLKPDLAMALNNLAWIRAAHPQAEFRDGPEAVRLAERACELTGNQQPVFIGTLGAAYAEAGRFEDAVAAARKARELALAAGQKDLADTNEKLMELFSARQPYREPNQPQP
jgi:tetratricopeptide (TPR) repeat protein